MEITHLNLCSADEIHELAEELAQCASNRERWGLLAIRGHDDPSFGSDVEQRILFAACRAVGQWELVAQGDSEIVDQLLEVDRFYAPIGGVVGYMAEALSHLRTDLDEPESIAYSDPEMIDIQDDSLERREAVIEGIRRMGQMAEIYPVGGVGDRLGLCDERDGRPLPVAALEFNGRRLLGHLFADLEAREQLYRDLMGCEITTPVVLMVSDEKGNREHILRICEEENWFGRPPESFYFVEQPLVPVVTPEGRWVEREGRLLTRPGGHGVLWRVMEEQGAFDWLFCQGRSHALLRQINNPLAGTDCNLLALSGYGWLGGFDFGFACCPRRVGGAEGMIVAFEDASGQGGISNVEYTEFARCGMEDEPLEEGGLYSRYPANTNILFADLAAVRLAASAHPFPGRLINLSKKLRTKDGMVTGGRLETTMQNIADYLTAPSEEKGRTFVTYGQREKTLSVTKRAYEEGAKVEETPVGCHFDYLVQMHQLLTECGVALPHIGWCEGYLDKRPGLLARVDASVGPLWSLIAQKIRGGRIARGSYLRLSAPQIDLEGVHLDGALIVEGEGSVTLRNVRIRNRGVDYDNADNFWKGDPLMREVLHIRVAEGASLYLEDVQIDGGRELHLESGECYSMGLEKESAWRWEPHLDADERILIQKIQL